MLGRALRRQLGGLALVALAPALASAEVVDNFEGDTLDFSAWRLFDNENIVEIIREVDTSNGSVVLGAATQGETLRIPLRLSDRSTAGLSGLMSVIDVDGGDGEAAMRIEGVYYRTGDAAPGAEGAVYAGLLIGEPGDQPELPESGLQAWYIVVIADDPAFETFVIHEAGQVVAPGTLELGEEYSASVEYDGDQTFTFSVAGNSETVEGPARQGEANFPYQQFSARVIEGDAPKRVRGTIREPRIHGEPADYDTFETTRLDPTKWDDLAFTRAANDGRLHLAVQGEGLNDGIADREVIGLFLREQANPPYIEATVNIPSGNNLDANAEARQSLIGVLYNIRRDGGDEADEYLGSDGDVLAQIRIDEVGGTLSARAYVEVRNQQGGTDQVLLNEPVGNNLDFDTDYRLYIRVGEEQVELGVDDLPPATLNIPETAYAPSPASLDGYRLLRLEVRGTNASGGTARSNVDEVRLSPAVSDDTGNGDGAPSDNGTPGDGNGSSSSGGGGSSSSGCSIAAGGGELPLMLMLVLSALWIRNRFCSTARN